jgi:hypothetical protein
MQILVALAVGFCMGFIAGVIYDVYTTREDKDRKTDSQSSAE